MANSPRNYSELNKAHEAAKGQITIVPKVIASKKQKRKDKRTADKTRKFPNRFVHSHPPTEAAAIRAKIKESGLTPAKFFAAAALKVRIRAQVDAASFRAAMWELGKIGTNWNQMTKIAHQRGYVPECAILERVGSDIQAAIQRLTPK